MTNAARLAAVSLILAMAFAAPLAGDTPQVVAVPPGGQPQRDAPPPPSVRRVPVGTSVVTGVVTAADTGRPLRGVRVNINGSTGPLTPLRSGGPGPAGATAPGRAGAPGQIVNPSPSASRTAMTDAQGVYTFEHLPAGHYTITASRNAYLATNYGQKRPQGAGSVVPLGEGQKLTLNMQLLRGGVISGTVYGDDGEPVSQVQVMVWRYAMSNGTKRLQQTNGGSTDDRGAYRVPNLQPGEYVVSARPNNSDAVAMERMLADTMAIQQAVTSGAIQAGTAPGFPATVAIPVPQQQSNRPADNLQPGFAPVYHPGTVEPRSATMLRVVGGDEHRFIDIQLRHAPAGNIVGSVTNPPGQDLGVQLVLMSDDPMFDSRQSTRTDASGQYIFRNIAPGKYTVHAEVVSAPQPVIENGMQIQRVGPMPPLQDSQKMWGRDSVTLDGQHVVQSSVTLRPGRSISGTVVFDMERPPDLTRARLSVILSQAPDAPQVSFSQLPQAVIGPDGRFTLNAVAPGRYTLRASGAWVKSSMVDGRDVLDFPFDFTGETDLMNATITVTDQVTEIAGTLTDVTGQPAGDSTVIVAPSDDRFWTPGSRRIQMTRTRSDGQYRFGSLPEGNYILAVVTDIEFGMQYDHEFLRALSSTATTTVMLGAGQKLQRDLRVAR